MARRKKGNLSRQIWEDNFDTFWKSYPARNGARSGKVSARKAWHKIEPKTVVCFDAIMKSLIQHKLLDQWVKDDGQFIPMASTWVNQMRWQDDMVADNKLSDHKAVTEDHTENKAVPTSCRLNLRQKYLKFAGIE